MFNMLEHMFNMLEHMFKEKPETFSAWFYAFFSHELYYNTSNSLLS